MTIRIALILLAFAWFSCTDKSEVSKTEETNYVSVDVNGKNFHYFQSEVLADDTDVDVSFTNSSTPGFGMSISLRGVDLRHITYPFKLKTPSAENTEGLFAAEIADNSRSTITYVKWMVTLGAEGATPFEATLTSFDGTHLVGTFQGAGAQLGETTGPAAFKNGRFSATIKFSKP